MQTILEGVAQFFRAVFVNSDGSAVAANATGDGGYAGMFVQWLIATPIALIPLYLYIMVALLGTLRKVLPGV